MPTCEPKRGYASGRGSPGLVQGSGQEQWQGRGLRPLVTSLASVFSHCRRGHRWKPPSSSQDSVSPPIKWEVSMLGA